MIPLYIYIYESLKISVRKRIVYIFIKTSDTHYGTSRMSGTGLYFVLFHK
jgi:hypothetical protein